MSSNFLVCFKVQIYAGTLLNFQGCHGARGAVEKVFPLEINFKKVCMCASQGAWILACSHDEFISLPIEKMDQETVATEGVEGSMINLNHD